MTKEEFAAEVRTIEEKIKSLKSYPDVIMYSAVLDAELVVRGEEGIQLAQVIRPFFKNKVIDIMKNNPNAQNTCCDHIFGRA